MRCSLEIKVWIRLNDIVQCVFDQAFYAKGKELYWKRKELFVDLVRTIMLLGVIESRFGNAGLKELVQSDVVPCRALNKALNRNRYSETVHLYKSIYEALMRLLLNEFASNSIQSFPSVNLDGR